MGEITYIFEGGKTFALREGKVIAASTDPEDVERQVKQAHPMDFNGPGEGSLEGLGAERDLPDSVYPGSPSARGCPSCGAPDAHENFCPHCGEPLAHGVDAPGGQEMGNPYPHDEPSPGHELGGEAGSYMAKTVTTPNGLKGTVLGKVAGLWGDQVTVRLENGRIVRLPVGTELHSEKTVKTAATNPIERLETRLAATPDGTRESLAARSHELEGIKQYASTLIRDGASHADSIRLDQIVVTAEVEQAEVADAVAHLDDVDSIQAPGFSIGVAQDTPGISREDASWLDHTLDEMIAEAEQTDFTKLMDEGPEALTAELPDSALADSDITHQMASSFIAEKTAGVDRKIAEPYMTTFLARVEECRHSELSTRKQTEQTIVKEAAAEEDKYKDLPDASLFL